MPQEKIVSSVDAPVIRELQEPHLKFSSGGVKSSRRTVKFEKNVLGHFLRFGGIVDDAKRDCQNQTIVAIEEHSKGISVPLLHFDDQLFIGQTFFWQCSGIPMPVPSWKIVGHTLSEHPAIALY